MPGIAAAAEGGSDQPALLNFLGKEHDLLASVEAVTFLGNTLPKGGWQLPRTTAILRLVE